MTSFELNQKGPAGQRLSTTRQLNGYNPERKGTYVHWADNYTRTQAKSYKKKQRFYWVNKKI